MEIIDSFGQVAVFSQMLGEATWYRFKVLIIGAHQLVRDNVSVLLRTLGGRCVLSSSLKQAPALLEKETPDAAILDQQLLKSGPAEILAALHRLFFRLQGRTVLLTREGSDPPSLRVLDAYAIPKVPVDLVFQELWPCLDSLLRRNIAPCVEGSQLVFDSLLQPLPRGIRSTQPTDRSLLYEAGDVTVDLWLEPDRDFDRVRLVGQIVDQAKTGSEKPSYPVVLVSKAEPIAAATSNAMGEFQLEFDAYPHPPMKLEIGVRERRWISLELPEFSSATEEIQAKA